MRRGCPPCSRSWLSSAAEPDVRTILISQSDRLVKVDIRPSDAIILALICQVPIFVAEQVLAHALPYS